MQTESFLRVKMLLYLLPNKISSFAINVIQINFKWNPTVTVLSPDSDVNNRSRRTSLPYACNVISFLKANFVCILLSRRSTKPLI